MEITKKEIAECVGLWLAEGDRKSRYEITFTNNCFVLIQLFHKVMKTIYGKEYTFQPRLYSYSRDKQRLLRLEDVRIKDYIDLRANKPYYIYRLGSVQLNLAWKNLIIEYTKNNSFHIDILRGFFAGEGNIKAGKKGNRVIRIAQKQPLAFVDEVLTALGVRYCFVNRERSYSIWTRESWDKLAGIEISKLHPDKDKLFWKVYNEFKEYHYSNYFLKDLLYGLLNTPHTTRNLSLMLKRTPARVCEVLIELKNEGRINCFHVGSLSYWIRNDSNSVIISSLKQKYLKLLTSHSKTSEIARELKVTWKSAFRRLSELNKLGLTTLDEGEWQKVPTEKNIIVMER